LFRRPTPPVALMVAWEWMLKSYDQGEELIHISKAS
jgi:hypothetical protein